MMTPTTNLIDYAKEVTYGLLNNIHSSLKKEDTDAAVSLFAKHAFDSIRDPENRAEESEIKQFIHRRESLFTQLVLSNLPFSTMKKSTLEKTLETMPNLSDDFITHLLLQTLRENTKALEEALDSLVPRLPFYPLASACSELAKKYSKGNMDAGYILLSLIKKSAQCDYEIPDKKLFTESTVSDLLSSFLKEEKRCGHPEILIPLFLNKKGRLTPLYCTLLNNGSALFKEFAIQHLPPLLMETLKINCSTLEELFNVLSDEQKNLFAIALAGDENEKGAIIGNALLEGLTDSDIQEEYGSFCYLQDLSKQLKVSGLESLLKTPFKEFSIRFYEGGMSLPFCRLNSERVFTTGSIIVGKSPEKFHSFREITPRYLFAYDTAAQTLIWSFPLKSSSDYLIHQVEDRLYLSCRGISSAIVLNMLTGEKESTVELFSLPSHPRSYHVTKKGVLYQRRGFYTLDIRSAKGDITSIQLPFDSAFIYPVSTYAFLFTSSQSLSGKCLLVINSAGHQEKFHSIQAFDVKDDTLCLLKKGSLSVYDLTHDEKVASSKKLIPIGDSMIVFEAVCDNNIAILREDKKDPRPLFVNLTTGEKKFYPDSPLHRLFIDKKSGTIWTWGGEDNTLRTITFEEEKVVGILDSSLKNQKLVYIDDQGLPYFI